MDRGAWWATVHGVKELGTTKRLKYLHMQTHAQAHTHTTHTEPLWSECLCPLKINMWKFQPPKERSRSVVSDSLRPHGLQLTRLLRSWDFPDKNTGVGCHFLLQGVFPIQGSNPGLPHCRQTFYHLSHQGSPKVNVFEGKIFGSYFTRMKSP